MVRRLTLVAGSGALVPLVAEAARRKGDILQILDLAGRDDLSADIVKPASLAEPTAIIEAIKTFPSTHLVFAGGVHISDADREGIARSFGWVGRLARSLGDVGLAGIILLYFRLNGIRMLGAHQIAADILAQEGLIAGPPLGTREQDYAVFALRSARAVGAIDLGQSVVVSGRRMVAAEDVGGTDALLERVAALRARGLVGDGSTPLVLAKALKPRQPTYGDLPAIGLNTIRNAAAAGITVVAIEAGRSLVLEREALVAAANAAGVSVLGLRVPHA